MSTWGSLVTWGDLTSWWVTNPVGAAAGSDSSTTSSIGSSAVVQSIASAGTYPTGKGSTT